MKQKKFNYSINSKISSYINEMNDIIYKTIFESNLEASDIAKKVLQLNFKKTRKVFEWYKDGMIDEKDVKQLKNLLLIDKEIFNLWEKEEYSNLCCLRCIEISGKTGNVCICRTKSKDNTIECFYCGCNGCKY